VINVTSEPSDSSKRKLWKKITEKLMEKILDKVNQNVQDALKNFQDTKNKERVKIQKQIIEPENHGH
jgi:formate dehydrogenase maturation protein FdhE